MNRPGHNKARRFLASRLFCGLGNVAELEHRIAALATDKERGDAFEVFAEAYLATQRKHDAAQVWPLSATPLDILQKLDLTTSDYGVDGVLRTTLGQLDVYQVKFRTDRHPLTWRELSTFMGLADSPQIHSRVLFTNCDDLPAVVNERRGFFCIRGSDLDRLEESDFKEIEAWLDGLLVPVAKKSPLPHQQEALAALLPALDARDRVSALMACGTGKTLVALWVAERLVQTSGVRLLPSPGQSPGRTAEPRNQNPADPRPTSNGSSRILVLLPSLALVRQTLHEWLHETRLPSLAYLCVCSDPTVTEQLDTIITQQSDLDFEVSTDGRTVREFLDAPFDGVKVIFSTYQSARVVGQALRAGERFDLGVFDEAHKTAGREGRNFAFALEDRNLPIRKRLFLTATPRHYNPHRKDKEGDAQLVFSMDKPEVYGPQAYRLTFAEAARRGIICPYKVIISVITSAMVTNELLSRGEVLVNGDAVRARQVANQIALRDAIEKYGVKKVFTFHSSVKSAASFTSDGNEGIGAHLRNVAGDVRRLSKKDRNAENGQSLPRNVPTGWSTRRKTHNPVCLPGLAGTFLGPMQQPSAAAPALLTPAATDHFRLFHVNGAMPTALRERVMCGFRECARGIISNARCLTEGVDVPAVDMVAFLSPRRSRVDIVQATGRAMRIAPSKTTGYVFVPLYVEQVASESIEEALERSEFDEVWAVLQAMQEHDEVLDTVIHHILANRRSVRGFDDSRFRERVEIIGPAISLPALRKAIATKLVTVLGRPWDTMVQLLLLYKKKLGHVRVPEDARGSSAELSKWIRNVRALRRQGRLSAEREAQLSAIGLAWRVRGQTLDDTKGLLTERQFRRESGFDQACKYRQMGIITPIGWGFSRTKFGPFYHPKQIRELRRKLGVTLVHTKGLVSEVELENTTGFTRIHDYRKKGLIKPVGFKKIGPGLTAFYRPKQIKDLKRRLGITLEDTSELLNEKQMQEVSGLKIIRYRLKGLIKPIGFGRTSGGLTRFYQPTQIKELKKELGITLDDTKGLLNEYQFKKRSRLWNVHSYRRQGLIRPVGFALGGGRLSAFYHPRQIGELKRRLAGFKAKQRSAG